MTSKFLKLFNFINHREDANKATVRYQDTPTRMTKKKRKYQMLVKISSNWNSPAFLLRVHMSKTTLRNYVAVSNTLEDMHILRPKYSIPRI